VLVAGSGALSGIFVVIANACRRAWIHWMKGAAVNRNQTSWILRIAAAIGRFHEGDLDRWRGGHWFHGEHLGRLGWWWVVGGAWYFYPAPVYPSPDPYVPPAVVTQVPPSPPTPSPPPYWYFCPSVKGYYPSVAECPEGWSRVVPHLTAP
jgi:hypothetical protein